MPNDSERTEIREEPLQEEAANEKSVAEEVIDKVGGEEPSRAETILKAMDGAEGLEIAPEPAENAPELSSAEQLDNAEAGESKAYVSYAKKGFRYGCYRFVKRTFDIFSSGLVLILLSWLILLCILIKWLEDFHNPIYVSVRVGKNGKPFKFYKIRTMCVGADKMKDRLIAEGKNESDGPVFKIKNDPRITKVGKVFRKLSLDELPQLWNIFIGTMSVVGPRPPIPAEVEQYTEEQRHRLDVKGGLLCLWQIRKNRNSVPFEEWVNLDIEYIRKQSCGLDLKIIFKGFFMVLFDRSGE